MRNIPTTLGPFTPREVFLVNCIRDLEERIVRLERCLQADSDALIAAMRHPDGKGED